MRLDTHRLFDEAPCGYVVFDRDGTVVESNQGFLAMVGRTRDEVVGRLTFSSLVTVAGRIFLDTHLIPSLDLDGRVAEVALELLGPEGRRVPVLLSANTMHVGGSALVRAVVFEARDRRSYEADLLRASRAAEEARAHAAALTETLQQTLIPPTPPRIDGLTVAAAYRPAGDGREVGGDFYDVFQVGPESWMVVIGDVSGKGIPAATLTAFVRHTVRALAIQRRDPAELLAELDAALVLHPTDRFCTLVALRLEREPDGWVLTGSVGGHPLPLLRDASGVRELGRPGPLVGVLRRTTFLPFRHVLEAGQSLVLYTDGVTEGRWDGDLYGVERLLRLVQDTGAAPEVLTERIVAEVLAFQHGTPRDDIAVVTLAPTPGHDDRPGGAGAGG